MTTLDHSFPTQWTPLESLLLFQSLRVDGVQTISFTRISEQLNQIPLVRNDPRYDSGRLSPDALRELYLRLLKEEARHDIEQKEEHVGGLVNGDSSPGSKKRKLASPTLPTVQEALEHSHLIPQLVTRLYARYRDHVLRQVRESEVKHAALNREIVEINAGKWDDHLQRARNASSVPTGVPAPAISIQTHEQGRATSVTGPTNHAQQQATGNAASQQQHHSAQTTGIPTVTPTTITARNTGSAPSVQSGRTLQSPAGTPTPPINDAAAHRPLHQEAYAQQQSTQSSQTPTQHAQQLPARPASTANPLPYNVATPRAGAAPQSGPQPPIRVNGSIQYQTPGQHRQSYPHAHVQGGRVPNNAQYSSHDPTQRTWSPVQQAAYYQQQSQQQQVPTAYPDRRMSTTPHQVPSYSHAQQQQPYQSASYQAAQSVQSGPQHHNHPQSSSYNAPPTAQTTTTGPHTAPRPAARANPHLLSSVLAALATPTRVPLWKSEIRPSTRTPAKLQPQPDIEPLSPTLRTRKAHYEQRDEPSSDVKAEEPSRTRAGRRRTNARDRSPHSVVSSIADESTRTRTRSQSTSTAIDVDTSHQERPSSRSTVKLEPSTPAEDVDMHTTSPSATPISGRMTRNRRGTLSSSHLTTTTKRKRQDSPDTTIIDHTLPSHRHTTTTPPPRSTKVIATRNFAKIASAILNDINSHKHAYHFEKPVRDRDAAGYSEIVYQPQNLKSIRTALSAGTRIVAAAVSAAGGESGGGVGTTVELERGLDTIPPKAIVNAAQLEKEVLRMFANAFMFNPGDDGMAADTREFFRDVEVRMGEWRDTEREIVGGGSGSAGSGRDGAGSGGEEEGRGKRRKI